MAIYYYVPVRYTVTETFKFNGKDFYRSEATPSPGLDYYSLVGGIYDSEDIEKCNELREAGVFDTVVYDPGLCVSFLRLSNYDNTLFFEHCHDISGGRYVKENYPTTRYHEGLGCIYHKVTQTIHSTNENEYESIFINYGTDYDSSGITETVGYGTHETVLYDRRDTKVSRGPYFLGPEYYPLKNGMKNVGSADPFTVTVTTTHEIIHAILSTKYESVMAALSASENVSMAWLIDDDVPYIDGVPKTIESIPDPNNSWVSIKQWDAKTWSELPSHKGFDMWSDGTNFYYSNGYDQYVLDKTTGTWSPKTWNGLGWFSGRYVWTDGTDIYLSNGYSQYVLDQSTSTWSSKTWTGLTSFYGNYVWKSGTGVFYSNASSQYVLNKSESKWVKKTWSGVSQPSGINIWTDGVDTYYSNSTAQYVLNLSTSTWSKKTWTGLTSFTGQYIWTYGNDIYYSNTTTQYVLDKETYTWIPKTWLGLTSFYGTCVWTYNDNKLYYSYDSDQYELNPRIPYRLSYLDMNESENLGEWLINNDIPYRISSAKLIPSQDYSDLWLTEQDPDAPKSDIEFDPNYRYVKLEFDYTVALNTTLTSESATTDLPNSGINISRGGYWWQRWLEIRPKTPVASRLYAAEFAIKEDNGLSDYYTNYLVQMEKGHNNGDVQAMSFSMEPRASGYTANTADLSTNGSAYTSETNTVYYNNSTAQVANLNNQVGVIIRLDQNSDEPEVKSGTVTCKLYYCFDSDESGYEALLAAYPNHASPYSPDPATKVPFRDDFTDLQESMAGPDMWFIDDDIPYRVQFPEFKSSIPATNAWLILDDIPFRIDYPDLLESVGAPESWLQDNGWEPRRPWPKHKNIVLEVQTIEDIPPVDWTKSMIQDYEFYTVDPHTWFDDKKLDNIISCNLTHDATTDKRGNASITLTEVIPECYIRTYLVVTQNGRLYKFCLGTFLYMTSSDSFDGMKHNITMTGYTPLVELEEQYPKLGYHVVGYTNRKYGAEAPMVTNEIRDIILKNTRCEVESRVMINKPLLNDFVPGQNDNWLTVVNNMLNASSLQSYILTVDEWGTIIIKDAPTIDDVATSFTYNDDNSSILLPTLDTFDDIYGIPNVMEVLYVGDKNLPAIRVAVKNEDEQSIVSIPRRGREIVKRYTINNIAAPLNDQTYASVYAQVEAQAYKLLEAASTIQKTISYSHGYCDVKVGDMVLINYERAGLNNVRAKVVSQRISCKPGCQVDEQAVYTKKLWNRGV